MKTHAIIPPSPTPGPIPEEEEMKAAPILSGTAAISVVDTNLGFG